MRTATALAAALLLTSSAFAEAPQSDHLKLERVVMVMRHGVRPPTRDPVVPPGVTSRTWPSWPVKVGLLTPRGAEGARLLGRYDRTAFAARGLLAETGCPAAGDLNLHASAKSRAIETAKAFAEGFAPGCGVTVTHPPEGGDHDPVFHPIDTGAIPIDGAAALRASQTMAPEGGLAAEVAARHADLDRLGEVLGCCQAPACPPTPAAGACSLSALPTALEGKPNDSADVTGALAWASTVSQTLALEYAEGKPMAEVGWGQVSKADIERLLAFHALKFRYEARPPYVADRAAAPLARHILATLKGAEGGRLTVFTGHDTNIAQLGGMLDLHWKIDGYAADSPPPGGALGFELLSDSSGAKFVRAFYRSQSIDQIRSLAPLTRKTPPTYAYLPIPGCGPTDSPCPWARFEALVAGKLANPAPAPK